MEAEIAKKVTVIVEEVSLRQARQAKNAKKKEREAHKARQNKLAQESMAKHHQRCGEWVRRIQECPTYTPTEEEFADPVAYIRRIQPEAARFGICKIVPPYSPAVPPGLVLNDNATDKRQFTFQARVQEMKPVQWTSWASGDFYIRPKKYSLQEYQGVASAYATKKYGSTCQMPPYHVEVEYWRQREVAGASGAAASGGGGGGGEAAGGCGAGGAVEYANDVVGTAFARPESGDPLGSTKWNLNVLPELPETLLPYIQYPIPGVTSPMLYIGMLHATFAWHIEDHYLYSINYHHMGAPKTWYGIPGSDADAFERFVLEDVYDKVLANERRAGVPESQRRDHGLDSLLNKTTIVHPKLLVDNGVAVYRAIQQAGEFVITFPRAYHAGFSHGFNCGEAVNFAMPEWLPYALAADARLARLHRRVLIPTDCMLCCAAMELINKLAPPVSAASAAVGDSAGGSTRDGGGGASRLSAQPAAAAASGVAAAVVGEGRPGPSSARASRASLGGPPTRSGGRPAAPAAVNAAVQEAGDAAGDEGEAEAAAALGDADEPSPPLSPPPLPPEQEEVQEQGGEEDWEGAPARVSRGCPELLVSERDLGPLHHAVAAAVAEGRAMRPSPLLSTLVSFWRLVRRHLTHVRVLTRGGASLEAMGPEDEDTVCSCCDTSCFLAYATCPNGTADDEALSLPYRCLACATAGFTAAPAAGAAAGGNFSAADVVIYANHRLRAFRSWVRLLDGHFWSYDGPETALDCAGKGLQEARLYGEVSGLDAEEYGWGRPYPWDEQREEELLGESAPEAATAMMVGVEADVAAEAAAAGLDLGGCGQRKDAASTDAAPASHVAAGGPGGAGAGAGTDEAHAGCSGPPEECQVAAVRTGGAEAQRAAGGGGGAGPANDSARAWTYDGGGAAVAVGSGDAVMVETPTAAQGAVAVKEEPEAADGPVADGSVAEAVAEVMAGAQPRGPAATASFSGKSCFAEGCTADGGGEADGNGDTAASSPAVQCRDVVAGVDAGAAVAATAASAAAAAAASFGGGGVAAAKPVAHQPNSESRSAVLEDDTSGGADADKAAGGSAGFPESATGPSGKRRSQLESQTSDSPRPFKRLKLKLPTAAFMPPPASAAASVAGAGPATAAATAAAAAATAATAGATTTAAAGEGRLSAAVATASGSSSRRDPFSAYSGGETDAASSICISQEGIKAWTGICAGLARRQRRAPKLKSLRELALQIPSVPANRHAAQRTSLLVDGTAPAVETVAQRSLSFPTDSELPRRGVRPVGAVRAPAAALPGLQAAAAAAAATPPPPLTATSPSDAARDAAMGDEVETRLEPGPRPGPLPCAMAQEQAPLPQQRAGSRGGGPLGNPPTPGTLALLTGCEQGWPGGGGFPAGMQAPLGADARGQERGLPAPPPPPPQQPQILPGAGDEASAAPYYCDGGGAATQLVPYISACGHAGQQPSPGASGGVAAQQGLPFAVPPHAAALLQRAWDARWAAQAAAALPRLRVASVGGRPSAVSLPHGPDGQLVQYDRVVYEAVYDTMEPTSTTAGTGTATGAARSWLLRADQVMAALLGLDQPAAVQAPGAAMGDEAAALPCGRVGGRAQRLSSGGTEASAASVAATSCQLEGMLLSLWRFLRLGYQQLRRGELVAPPPPPYAAARSSSSSSSQLVLAPYVGGGSASDGAGGQGPAAAEGGGGSGSSWVLVASREEAEAPLWPHVVLGCGDLTCLYEALVAAHQPAMATVLCGLSSDLVRPLEGGDDGGAVPQVPPSSSTDLKTVAPPLPYNPARQPHPCNPCAFFPGQELQRSGGAAAAPMLAQHASGGHALVQLYGITADGPSGTAAAQQQRPLPPPQPQTQAQGHSCPHRSSGQQPVAPEPCPQGPATRASAPTCAPGWDPGCGPHAPQLQLAPGPSMAQPGPQWQPQLQLQPYEDPEPLNRMVALGAAAADGGGESGPPNPPLPHPRPAASLNLSSSCGSLIDFLDEWQQQEEEQEQQQQQQQQQTQREAGGDWESQLGEDGAPQQATSLGAQHHEPLLPPQQQLLQPHPQQLPQPQLQQQLPQSHPQQLPQAQRPEQQPEQQQQEHHWERQRLGLLPERPPSAPPPLLLPPPPPPQQDHQQHPQWLDLQAHRQQQQQEQEQDPTRQQCSEARALPSQQEVPAPSPFGWYGGVVPGALARTHQLQGCEGLQHLQHQQLQQQNQQLQQQNQMLLQHDCRERGPPPLLQIRASSGQPGAQHPPDSCRNGAAQGLGPRSMYSRRPWLLAGGGESDMDVPLGPAGGAPTESVARAPADGAFAASTAAAAANGVCLWPQAQGLASATKQRSSEGSASQLAAVNPCSVLRQPQVQPPSAQPQPQPSSQGQQPQQPQWTQWTQQHSWQQPHVRQRPWRDSEPAVAAGQQSALAQLQRPLRQERPRSEPELRLTPFELHAAGQQPTGQPSQQRRQQVQRGFVPQHYHGHQGQQLQAELPQPPAQQPHLVGREVPWQDQQRQLTAPMQQHNHQQAAPQPQMQQRPVWLPYGGIRAHSWAPSVSASMPPPPARPASSACTISSTASPYGTSECAAAADAASAAVAAAGGAAVSGRPSTGTYASAGTACLRAEPLPSGEERSNEAMGPLLSSQVRPLSAQAQWHSGRQPHAAPPTAPGGAAELLSPETPEQWEARALCAGLPGTAGREGGKPLDPYAPAAPEYDDHHLRNSLPCSASADMDRRRLAHLRLTGSVSWGCGPAAAIGEPGGRPEAAIGPNSLLGQVAPRQALLGQQQRLPSGAAAQQAQPWVAASGQQPAVVVAAAAGGGLYDMTETLADGAGCAPGATGGGGGGGGAAVVHSAAPGYRTGGGGCWGAAALSGAPPTAMAASEAVGGGALRNRLLKRPLTSRDMAKAGLLAATPPADAAWGSTASTGTAVPATAPQQPSPWDTANRQMTAHAASAVHQPYGLSGPCPAWEVRSRPAPSGLMPAPLQLSQAKTRQQPQQQHPGSGVLQQAPGPHAYACSPDGNDTARAGVATLPSSAAVSAGGSSATAAAVSAAAAAPGGGWAQPMLADVACSTGPQQAAAQAAAAVRLSRHCQGLSYEYGSASWSQPEAQPRPQPQLPPQQLSRALSEPGIRGQGVWWGQSPAAFGNGAGSGAGGM